jgi:aspartate/methionine/tyrosine aminotransferase
MNFQPAERIHRLEGPHLRATHGNTLRALERELEQQAAGSPFLDVTYADTHRFPPVDWALPEFGKAASGAGMTYTPYRGDAEVRADVARNIGNLIGHELDPAAEVILTPGTQAGLYCALATILNSGDKVVIPDPDYITSDRSVRYFDGEVLAVPLVWDAGRSPRLDLDVLRAQLSKKPKLVMFSHPNNPTGAVFTPEHVAEIADVVADSDALVLVDQLYCRLVYDDAPFAHFTTLPGMWERTLTTFGPSKTESLSGYRIGAAIGNPELINRIEDVMGIASLRAPAYAQHVMSRWIRDDDEYVRSRTVEYQALRDRTVVALSEMAGIDVRISGGSAYLFPSFAGLRATDQEVALALKRDAGLVVNPGYQFGAGGDQHFRICFAQEELVWETALERMASVLAGFPAAD